MLFFLSVLAFLSRSSGAECASEEGCSASSAGLLQKNWIDQQKISREAAVDATSDAARLAQEMHCCSGDETREFKMVCDATADDAIESVPFAGFGAPVRGTSQAALCGQEVVPNCGSSVQEEVESQCVGSQSCVVDFSKLGSPCPMAAGKRILTIRWECRSDSVKAWPALDEHGAEILLPALPLRAKGNVIVDADDQRVRMKGVNWSGGHQWQYVPSGLDVAPLRSIARLIRRLGFNFVRLTFSLEVWRSNPMVSNTSVAANPQLGGLRALDIFDKTVDALAQEGLMVWMDNHMLDADWCCHNKDCNGFWFNSRFSEDDFVETWAAVAERYANVPAVIGAGIKNEPRTVCNGQSWDDETAVTCSVDFANVTPNSFGCVELGWADGPKHLRYRDASERVGKAILEKNPRILVSVCGLNYCRHLQDVKENPINLPKENLVYEAHDYHWYHIPDKFKAAEYSSSSLTSVGLPLSHFCRVETKWGYILRDGLAPVLVSEWGTTNEAEPGGSLSSPEEPKWQPDRWLNSFAAYVQEEGPLADEGGLDWAYWQLSGLQASGTSRWEGTKESYGVLNQCWTAPTNAQHFEFLQKLMRPSAPSTAKPRNCEASVPDSSIPDRFSQW